MNASKDGINIEHRTKKICDLCNKYIAMWETEGGTHLCYSCFKKGEVEE
jgi:hypothetical protein